MVPTATTMVLLDNPTSPVAEARSRDAQAAAGTLGLQLHVLHANSDATSIRPSHSWSNWSGRTRDQCRRILHNHSDQFAALAVRHAVPTISAYREFAVAGGLMSYGGSLVDAWRQVGLYTGRILKGEKPADLPVQQSTKSSWSSTSRPPRRSASTSR